MSRVIHVRIAILKQHQMMMSSVAKVKFIKTKLILRYHIKSVSNQVSSNSDHKAITFSCSNSSTKVGRNEKVKRFSGLQNGAVRELQIGIRFRNYKSGQEGSQIGTALETSNRGKEITNRGKEISNRGRDFKSEQEGFQFGAKITNWCKTKVCL